jgi:hypothetical protein
VGGGGSTITQSALVAKIERLRTSALSTTEDALQEIKLGIEAERLALAQDNRNLRKKIAICVGVGLGIEVLLLFYMVLSQGLGHAALTTAEFSLEGWTFNVFTTAVLLQTFGLARLVVKNLFPDNETSPSRISARPKA